MPRRKRNKKLSKYFSGILAVVVLPLVAFLYGRAEGSRNENLHQGKSSYTRIDTSRGSSAVRKKPQHILVSGYSRFGKNQNPKAQSGETLSEAGSEKESSKNSFFALFSPSSISEALVKKEIEEVERYVDLSAGQKAKIRKSYQQMSSQALSLLQSGKSVGELGLLEGEEPESLENILTEEQFDEYTTKKEQEEERKKDGKRREELASLTEALDLGDAQAESVYGALAEIDKKKKERMESLYADLEAEGGSGDIFGFTAGLLKNREENKRAYYETLRPVLSEGQFNQLMEHKASKKRFDLKAFFGSISLAP